MAEGDQRFFGGLYFLIYLAIFNGGGGGGGGGVGAPGTILDPPLVTKVYYKTVLKRHS